MTNIPDDWTRLENEADRRVERVAGALASCEIAADEVSAAAARLDVVLAPLAEFQLRLETLRTAVVDLLRAQGYAGPG